MDLDNSLASDVSSDCVPVNMYASSLYPLGRVTGDFATPAERDYLYSVEGILTPITSKSFSHFTLSGALAARSLRPESAALGVGFEARRDEIKSKPRCSCRGWLIGASSPIRGAYGTRDVTEWFAELEIPPLVNKALFTELNVNISARFTDDEYYGNNTTEAVKLGWRPH